MPEILLGEEEAAMVDQPLDPKNVEPIDGDVPEKTCLEEPSKIWPGKEENGIKGYPPPPHNTHDYRCADFYILHGQSPSARFDTFNM